MDRVVIYPGQIPLETDLLNTNRNAMVALGKLAGAIFGTGTPIVNGLAVTPTSPPSLSVQIGPGEIYALQNVDNNAYSTLAADTTDTCIKQGILNQASAPVALACPAPTTAGYSVNYLIEATFSEIDGGNTVLPFYNAANPTQAFSGPGNSGTGSNTMRYGQVQLQAKAGVAAVTGTQVTPTTDAGYVALAVVTVANGQATITAANITGAAGGQVLSKPVTSGRLLGARVFTTSGMYVPSPGTNQIVVELWGAGGAGGGSQATNASQVSSGGGGGAGGYAKSLLTSGFAGQLITIGAGGAGVAGGAGNPGGTTGFGASLSASGGGGGSPGVTTYPASIPSGKSGTGSGANIINGSGAPGVSTTVISLSVARSGDGGGAFAFAGAGGSGTVGQQNGYSATGFGSGGGGANSQQSASAALAGGNGSPGYCVITEYA